MPTSRDGKNGSYAKATEQNAGELLDNAEWIALYKSETLSDSKPTIEDAKKWIQDFMIKNDLTWHECADRHTVIAIPTVINNAFNHDVGISLEKSVEAMRETLHQRFNTSLRLQSVSISGKFKIIEAKKSTRTADKAYRGNRRKMFKKK